MTTHSPAPIPEQNVAERVENKKLRFEKLQFLLNGKSGQKTKG